MTRPQEEQNRLPLWEYVPLARLSKPAPPAREALRKGLLGFWDKLKPSSPPAEKVVEEKSLQPLPKELMDKISPPPDWHDLVPALGEALKDWIGAENPGVAAVIGPPYGAVSEVARLFAESRRWPIFEAPEAEEILEGERWLERLDEREEDGLVMPNLERCYLRHHRGLHLLRKLLDRLLTSKAHILVGCDSWAWAYLCKTLGIDHHLSSPLTLQALDGNSLEKWFCDLIRRTGKIPPHCRATDNGKTVLSVQSDLVSDKDRKPAERTDFLEDVAAYSLGIPGIAWSLWRHSLRLAACDEVEEKARDAAAADGDRTVWVRPWAQIQLPALPVPAEQDQLFVLHAVLLHGGLSLPLLSQMLPFPRHVLIEVTQRLQKNALIENRQGI
jgi:hypothetical protein